MRKFLLFVVTLTFLLSAFYVSADLVNPLYWTEKCKSGEKTVECRYKKSEPSDPSTYNECLKYERDPDYYFLVREGHSFGGKAKYCYKPLDTDFVTRTMYYYKNFIQTIPLTILINLVIELILFTLIIKPKIIKTIVLFSFANIISSFVVNFIAYTYSNDSFYLFVLFEILVLLFEMGFIYLFGKIKDRRVYMAVIVANVATFLLAILFMLVISGRF